jgi:hypothetical protein
VDLHNNINKENGKDCFDYSQSRAFHKDMDPRTSFIQFVFAVSFTIPAKRVVHLRTFCKLAFPTVGLEAPVNIPDHNIPFHLFGYIKPYTYTNFDNLVSDFVPPTLYGVYGMTALIAPVYEPPPCTHSIVDASVRSIVHEERINYMNKTDRDVESMTHRIVDSINNEGLMRRIHHYCPLFVIPTLSDLSPQDASGLRVALEDDLPSDQIAQLIMSNCLVPDPDEMVHYLVALCVLLIVCIITVVACVRRPYHRGTLVLVAILLSVGIYVSVSFPRTGLPLVIVSIVSLVAFYGWAKIQIYTVSEFHGSVLVQGGANS